MVLIEYSDVKIGLEIHVPITSVETKLFCSCPNTSRVRPERPNQYVCPICLGLPGALPRPNEKAIIACIRAAKALNCKISNYIQFYRKHYFYPDLPKGYQITQYEGGGFYPIGVDGYLRLSNGKLVRIRRVHLEEDPAKLIHPAGLGESDYVYVDYNRSGNPLIEIVTDPDISSPEEARELLEKVKRILTSVGVLDEDVDVTIRCDANVSIKGSGRIEIKNIGNPSDVEKALSFEIIRLRRYVEEGVGVSDETRHWDERRRVTVSLREKEVEEEYRYFPDPNIPKIDVSVYLNEALKDFPILEDEAYETLTQRYGLSNEAALVLSRTPKLLNVFNIICEELRGILDEELVSFISNVLINEGARLLKEGRVSASKLAELIILLSKMVREGLLTKSEARRRLAKLTEERVEGRPPTEDVIRKHLEDLLKREKILIRDEASINYLIGRVIRELEAGGWRVDPSRVAEVVRKSVSVEEEERRKPITPKPALKPVEYGESIVNKKLRVSEAFRLRSGEHLLAGWLERKFEVGEKVFIILRDWTGKIQCVIDKTEAPSAYELVSRLPKESFVVVEGTLTEDRRAPGGVEVRVSNLLHLGGTESPPLSLKDMSRAGPHVRFSYRYLDLRRRKIRAILSFRAKLLSSIREYLTKEGFVEVNTPKIIATATEGGAELFPLLFYGNEAFLAQSPQLYKQMALNAFEKVFEIASYYRAQKFDTPRHLAEFWSVDVEASFYKLEDLLDLLENLLIFITDKLNSEARGELEILNVELPSLSKPFERYEYSELVDRLRNSGYRINFGDDLGTDELRALDMTVNRPYFVLYWPRSIRAFYYKPAPADRSLTLSFDLMWTLSDGTPLELASGGERINNAEELIDSLKDKGLYPDAYKWYIDMFKYGMPPHGGFGLGLDRLVVALLNLSSITEATFLPRTPKFLVP